MEIIPRILESVSMTDLLEHYGIMPARARNNYICFVHDDHNPSASVDRANRKFKCFACGFSGDVINVVCELRKCDMKRAVRIIDDEFNLGLFRELSQKEKLEIARQSRERERLLAEKRHYQLLEKEVLDKICRGLKVCYEKQSVCKRMKGIKSFDERYEYFIENEKEIMRLEWLYDTICQFKDKRECEYDYLYGDDKLELLKSIEKGEIEI